MTNKTEYFYSNLLGGNYNGGRLKFLYNSDKLLIPIGNRLSSIDIKRTKQQTSSITTSHNIDCIDLTNDGRCTAISTENNKCDIFYGYDNYLNNDNNLHLMNDVHLFSFAPDSLKLAIVRSKELRIFLINQSLISNPFVPYRFIEFRKNDNEITSIGWSTSSKFLFTTSKNCQLNIYSIDHQINPKIVHTLNGHSRSIIYGTFINESPSLHLLTVDESGKINIWYCNRTEIEIEEINMKKSKKTYQNDCDIPSLDSIMEETLKNSLTSKSDEEEEEEEKEVEEIGSKLNLQFIRQNQYNLKKMRRELNKNDQLNDLQVKSCVYSKTKRILVVAYNDGSISVHPLAATHQIENKSAKKLRMENEEENSNENIMNDVKIFGGELSLLYVVGVVTLTNSDISSLTFNSPKDDWVAIGCKESGNITIWDWSSQIVVLKQNYRQNQILSLAHSPDKNYISLGLSNGFVQIWDSVTAICYMTFKEHTQNVNSLEFAPNSRSLFSGSSDGTIRAYDLNRYRNFRTFTTPRESQVETMSVDSSGEIIAASGSLNDFSIYIWSVQTGLLLDTLSGHEAKISSIKFSPLKNVTLFSGEGENFSAPNVIATCSWDGSLRLTNIYDSKRSTDILNVSNECITVAWQNDGKIIAISTTTCKIIFYSIENGNELNEINGLYDIGFQRTSQSTTAKKRGTSQYFTCLDYSTDNRLLLAAANSPLICLYDAKLYQLLQRFTLTTNLSVSGVVGMFNEKHLNRYEKRDNKNILKLPGTTEIDPGERYMTHKLIVRQVNFSSTDTLFSVLSSEGCMIFSNEIDLSYDIFSSTNSFDRIELEEMNLNDSKDDYQLFPPFFINETISTKIIKDHIDKKEYQLSLLKSLKYGRYSLIRETFNSIKINCSNIDALINDFIEFTLCTNDSCIRLILLLRFIDSLSYSLDKLISIDFIITLIERLLWNNCGAFQKLLYSHDKVKSIQENIKMNVTTSTSDEDIMKTNENIEIKENHLQYLDEKNLIEQLKLSLIRLQKRLNEKPKDLVDLQQNVTSSFQFVCEQLKLKQ